MDGYKRYIKTIVAGTDTLVVDGYSDWQADKFDPVDTQLSGTHSRHFDVPLYTERGQVKYKIISGQMVERTQTELDSERAARPVPPDPDQELAAAITNATTLDELKKALLGNNGNLARVKGKLK